MRVLQVLPRMIGGGPERGVLAMRRVLREAGFDGQHDIAVLDRPVAARLVLEARRLGSTVHIAPSPEQVAALAGAADVTVFAYWNHPRLTALIEKQAWPPCRLVAWLHVLGKGAPQVFSSRAGALVDALLLTSCASRTVPAVAAAVARGAAVDVVPNLADMRRLDGFTPRSHEGIVVGYIGSLDDTKLYPRFLEMAAAVRTPGVRFVVAGDGGQREAMQHRVDAMGLGAKVTLLGHCEDVRSVLEEIDIFGYPLAPGTSATSDKTVQEAMWVGLPVVVMGPNALQAMIRHDDTGLIAADEAGYVAAIERLAVDGMARARLGAAARDYARRTYAPETLANAGQEALERAARLPRRARPAPANPPTTGAALLATTLGSEGADLAASVAAGPEAENAERRIAAASYHLAHGEGGVFHYRHTFPNDPHLRLWSALILRAEGRTAEAEEQAAAACKAGLPHHRLTAHGFAPSAPMPSP